MATKNLVPRATNEGSIGTSAKRWLAGYFGTLYASAISGLTTPLSIAQGGTGATDAAGARENLGISSIPAGGNSGEVLGKTSGTDYDVGWIPAAAGTGGSLTIAHSHVTGPVAVDPEFTRLSAAYDDTLKRWEYNNRRWDSRGTMVEEGTTNLLPTGSELFNTTFWSGYNGETLSYSDYPVYIPELEKTVTARRITGIGNGTSAIKLLSNTISGLTSGRSIAVSVYAMSLNTATITKIGDMYGNTSAYSAVSTAAMQLVVSAQSYASVYSRFVAMVSAATDILDIVVYAPQIEAKPYATTYTPPGTTRAAETLSLPINAYQKNLLTLNQATGGDTLGDTTGFSIYNGSVVTRDTTKAWNGTGCIKVVTPGSAQYEGCLPNTMTLTAGKIYTVSAYICGNAGGESVRFGVAGIGSTINTLTTGFGRVSYTFVGTGSSQQPVFSTGEITQSATFWIDGLQLEEGTTASDWTLPAVDYTNALINPTAFSVEFDYVPTSDDKSATRTLFGIGTSTDKIQIYTKSTSGYYGLSYVKSSVESSIISTVSIVAGTKKGFKISVSGSTLTLAINGVDVGTCAYNGLPSILGWLMCFGSNQVGVDHRNGYISNVRIRNTSLTATERAYVGTLTPDAYTTYCSECKESISSRPFVKDSLGQAQRISIASESPNQNAIYNGDFRLATRGTSFSNPTTASYLFDGVRHSFNGSGATRVISQESFMSGQQEILGAEKFLRIYQSVAPTGQTYQSFTFRKEDVSSLNGKKCQVSFYARSPESITLSPQSQIAQIFGSGGSSTVSNYYMSGVKLTPQFKKYSFPVLLSSTAGKTIGAGNYLDVYISLPINAAFTLDIADVQLKPADAPDAYPRLDLPIQQAIGRRYLQALPTNLQLRAVNIQADYIDFESVLLPTEMRATPALSGTYAETTNWKVLVNNTQTTGFTLALLNASANQVAFRATKTAHGLTDATLQLVTNVLLSAEL